MGIVSDVVGGIFGGGDDSAAQAATSAASTEAQAQREALNYMKEREAIPRQFSEAALKGLGGLYGLKGGTGSQQDLINRAISSPLYQNIIGGQQAGEESILRNAAATGGLRSGNVQSALYDYNTRLRNQALLESYNQQLSGLQGLAGLPSNSNQIAQQMSNIGATQAAGITAAGQAQQASSQQSINNLMGLGGLGIAAYGAGMFSDRRLKSNITKIGEAKGHNIYSWDWNIVANKMGLNGSTIGVMADEVYETHPEAVSVVDLFLFVYYSNLGLIPIEVN